MNKWVWIVLILCVFGCHKKAKNQPASQHPVPYTPVAISIYPNDPLHYTLQNIGGWKYITGGVNGIVVYRKSDQEFVALERTSTYDPNNAAAKVFVTSDNFTLRDTVSNSTWRILDGAVTKGPAEWALRLYGCSFDGNLLRITN